MAEFVHIDEVLEMCGVVGDEGARQEQVEDSKRHILDNVIQDENLREILLELDEKFRANQEEAPNWARLFAGVCGSQAEDQTRPIRPRGLSDLEQYYQGQQVSICKRFDLDTITTVSKKLDVLNSIRLIFRRNSWALRSERDDLARGRLYICRSNEENGGDEFPRVKFRADGLPNGEEALNTGYVTKRFIGFPGGHWENNTYVAQVYCNLGSDHEKWVAWECCYLFMAGCLRGGWAGSPDLVIPRSSSFCIPDPHEGGYTKDWMQGIAVSSREDCREFMELILDRELQERFFESEFAKVVELVSNRHRRYLDRLVARQGERDDNAGGNIRDEADNDENRDEDNEGDDDGNNVDDGDQLEMALDEEVGQALEDGRQERGDGDLMFDDRRCMRYFTEMMDNLYFVTTIQFGRRGCGTIKEQILPRPRFNFRRPLIPETREVTRNIMKHLEEYICIEQAANCPMLLAPNVGMEVTVQKNDGKLFKVPSPLFEQEQGIRMHLDRRKMMEKKQTWARRLGYLNRNVPGQSFKFWDAWGNMSKTDGPVGFKGKLGDQQFNDEGGEIDALLRLMMPTDGHFGVQAPILCIYECTYRATSPYSIFQKEKQMLSEFKILASKLSTNQRRLSALEEICKKLRTELQGYLKRLPGDAPLRFETVFPLQHPQNFDLNALRWSATCNEKITLMALADVKSILGYSLTDEYPTLTEMLLPWIYIVEYQGTRMLAEQHCISPLIMDSLALAHGQLSYIMSGYTGDASDRVITQHFRRRPGLALRKSMERNGFARVPDSILLCNVSWMVDQNQRLVMLTGAQHSFITGLLLGKLIKENYSLYRSYHFRKYTSLCCGEVFAIARPSAFPPLMREYLGLALLQYLVTKVHFRLIVSLSENQDDLFSNYRIRRLEYRHQRGQDEDWLFQFAENVLTPGNASSVFEEDIFLGIMRKLEVEAILAPHNIEFTVIEEHLRYDNRDGVSESLIMDVMRRADLIGRIDQTLYMEAFRAMLYQVDTSLAREGLVDQKSILIQEMLMACVHHTGLRFWPQIHRMHGNEERLKVWRLGRLGANEAQQPANYFHDLNRTYYESLRRRFTNHEIIEMGAFEILGQDFDELARNWQARQIANHFFSLSKRLPDRVRIVE